MSLHTFFAQTQGNLSDLTAREAEQCGGIQVTQRPGGVRFRGSIETGYRFCLWSRTASRLLLQLHQADPVEDPKDIFALAVDVPWENHLYPESTIAVSCTSKNTPWMTNTHGAALTAKDGLADRMREMTGSRPDVDTASPDIQIHLHVEGTEGSIYLDLSGESLHKRGYRRFTGKASLKEHLAAAVLLRSGWDRCEGPLLDPFCGSGVIPIEAALIAMGIAPGLYRKQRFGFLSWAGHDPLVWREVLKEAEERRKSHGREIPLIAAWDNDPAALDAARGNIREAGLKGRILVQYKDASKIRGKDLEPFGGIPGMIVTDMPYGVRSGSTLDLPKLYESFGSVLTRQFSGWEAAVLAHEPELLSSLKLKPTRTNALYNGPIECLLGRFEIFSRKDRERMTEKHQDREETELSAGAQMFANRLMKNWKQIRKYILENQITCYRLYDADMPEYSAAVDVYEGTWVHLQEYAPPKTVDPQAAERRLQEIIEGVRKVTGVDYRDIYIKTRKRGKHQYRKHAGRHGKVLIQEGSLQFYINLTEYLDTGIFLDHRIIRDRIRSMAKGSRFLNLFGYTGTAAVYAAAGGAASTLTVDLSSTYLDWAKENMAVNKIPLTSHRFIRDDVFHWLKQSSETFDLIFLDPPTFSNSKDVPGTLDTQRDHPALIALAMEHLSPKGTLIFSTNYRKFSLDEQIPREYSVKDITQESIPDDFRNRNIHTCYLIRKKQVRTVKVKKHQ